MKRTRRLTCKGKVSYPRRKDAEDAMFSYFRRTMGGVRTNAHSYKCGDHWHWGHYRNRKR